jgi:hypothetical protein
MLEFAVLLPVLALILVGAGDFGRAFYHSVTVSNAAETGSLYGAQDVIRSGRFAEMAQAAQNDARDLGTVSATANRFCACGPAPAPGQPWPDGAIVNCLTGSCSGGYGAPKVYVRCRVQRTFNTLVNLPGVPDLFPVRRDVYMRVQ